MIAEETLIVAIIETVIAFRKRTASKLGMVASQKSRTVVAAKSRTVVASKSRTAIAAVKKESSGRVASTHHSVRATSISQKASDVGKPPQLQVPSSAPPKNLKSKQNTPVARKSRKQRKESQRRRSSDDYSN